MAKLNDATRNAILRDLPATYAANGNELPEVSAAIVAETDAMLKKLRASKQTKVRGSVGVNYSVQSLAAKAAAESAKAKKSS